MSNLINSQESSKEKCLKRNIRTGCGARPSWSVRTFWGCYNLNFSSCSKDQQYTRDSYHSKLRWIHTCQTIASLSPNRHIFTLETLLLTRCFRTILISWTEERWRPMQRDQDICGSVQVNTTFTYSQKYILRIN